MKLKTLRQSQASTKIVYRHIIPVWILQKKPMALLR